MRKIAFSPPDMGADEIREVGEALRSGWITTGPRTKEFEKRIGAFCHTGRAVCLNSATACLELILRLLGIGPGDEVITSAYTYTASASPVCHVGARLVLVDTARDSWEMDYQALEAAITERTKAIIPVDLGGVMCDYDRMFQIVRRQQAKFQPKNKLQEAIGRICVIADAAHAFGAWRQVEGQKRICGEAADFTSFSFHAVKNLTTAEGGALTWRPIPGIEDDWIYQQFMLLSLHGQSKDALAKTKLGAWEYDIVSPAYKCNMTDIMAALGLVQLERYPGLLKRRRELIQIYDRAMDRLGIEYLRHEGADFRSSGHLYLIRVPGYSEGQRNEVITHMAEQGIACNVHYKPLPMMTAYRDLGFSIESYPNAYAMFANEISLPLHTGLSNEDAEYVCVKLQESLHGFEGMGESA
ncbi:MAG: DegT/DnrJ/EryC1/StrS family aminotransferase [Lachnospiraceae bacterium]|nr:DegT/DnrJ/EryC1/StrS family aminotransferase [Lachnospiraceae bacterium]MCI9132972.1 DegT/DnrJ/EryC1/StrS family aminotransferase [Lachnospiraceae bacterium]